MNMLGVLAFSTFISGPNPGHPLGVCARAPGQQLGGMAQVAITQPRPAVRPRPWEGPRDCSLGRGAGHSCSTLELAPDVLDDSERKVGWFESVWQVKGDLFVLYTSFNMSGFGHVFQGAVTVRRWPRAAVLPPPEEIVSGSLGMVQWAQPWASPFISSLTSCSVNAGSWSVPLCVETLLSLRGVSAVVFVVHKHPFITDLKLHLLTIKMHCNFNSACLFPAFCNICRGTDTPVDNNIFMP